MYDQLIIVISVLQIIVADRPSASNRQAVGADQQLGQLTLTRLELRGAYVSEREQIVRSQPAGALVGRQSRAQPVALMLTASLILPSPGVRVDGGTGEEGAEGETGDSGRGFECPVRTSVAAGSESAMTLVATVPLQCAANERARLALEASLVIQTLDTSC